MPVIPQPGDFVLYGDNCKFLAKVSTVQEKENKHLICIENKKKKCAVIIPLRRMHYVVSYKIMPEEFNICYNENNFFPRQLTQNDVNMIVGKAATIIQRHVKHILYSPPNGKLYIQSMRHWNKLIDREEKL